MKKTLDKNKIEFILFIFGIIGIIIFKIIDSKDNRDISKNQGYAIGTLTDFYKGKAYVAYYLTVSPPTVTFKYKIDTTEYMVNYSTDTYPINENLAVRGKKYLVVYNQSQKANGRILLEYPITDSSDYKRVIGGFTIDPKRFKLKN